MSTSIQLADEEVDRKTPGKGWNKGPNGSAKRPVEAARGEIIEWNLSVVPPLVRDENGWRTAETREINEERSRRETVSWSDVRDKLIEGKFFSVAVDDPAPPDLDAMLDATDAEEQVTVDRMLKAGMFVLDPEVSPPVIRDDTGGIIRPATFEEAFDAVIAKAKGIMIDRQRKYGKDNILEFGQVGVFLRSRDKSNRLKHVYFDENGNPRPLVEENHGDESIDDTWFDNLNYSIIALMLRAGTFTAPLKGDQ